MSKNGLLIHYEYCTGCQSCAVACQQEHDFPAGKSGVKVTEYVYEALKKPVAIDFMPFITELCDLCINRSRQGEQPACVKHCQAACMAFGPIDELAKKMENMSRVTLVAPR
jgi:Fe-S-cluster-containing dehydrogenase component